MQIGIPRERKVAETRVGMTPEGVNELVSAGHDVVVEVGAGEHSDIPDEAYREAGAVIVDREDAWASDLVVKVKEPLESEYEYLDGQIVFTYFHLAASEDLTRELIESNVTAIAYETVERDDGTLPLLRPMSQVAGRIAPLVGTQYLSRHHEGRGVLPTGLPGVEPADVVVIGGGTVGANAARVAAGMGTDVTILEIDQDQLGSLETSMPANVSTRFSNSTSVREAIINADVVIGAVLVPGAGAPEVVSKEDVAAMQDGAVIVDVAIDQGGCIATAEPTTHTDPVYLKHGVVHYAVTNMPSAYPRTATYGLTNATIPYVKTLVEKGWRDALAYDPVFRRGLNVAGGAVTYETIADEFGVEYVSFDDLPAMSN